MEYACELTLFIDISSAYLNIIQRFVAKVIIFSISKQKDSLVEKHNVEFKSMKILSKLNKFKHCPQYYTSVVIYFLFCNY